MSTKEEEQRSLEETKKFLFDLLSVDKYPKNKTEMRKRASYCLKHFPSILGYNISKYSGYIDTNINENRHVFRFNTGNGFQGLNLSLDIFGF